MQSTGLHLVNLENYKKHDVVFLQFHCPIIP